MCKYRCACTYIIFTASLEIFSDCLRATVYSYLTLPYMLLTSQYYLKKVILTGQYYRNVQFTLE